LPDTRAELAVIGAGAAGLMAAIWAGRTNKNRRILVLDGARKLGAKILVSGGARCNVTHWKVEESSFFGSSQKSIRKVLRRFDVPAVISFFRELGVELKREETGKLFPVTDDSRTVLDALLRALRGSGARVEHPRRVERIVPCREGFLIEGAWGSLQSQRVILATGGLSLPKSGSDGHGYLLARSLGHSLSPRLLPGLVPLTLPPNHFIRELSGLTLQATLELRDAKGRRLVSFTDSTLCTHFGLSGPSVLDISRHYLEAREEEPGARLLINWLPSKGREELDSDLQQLGKMKPVNYLRRLLPDRLAEALAREAGIDAPLPGHQLSRADRLRLVRALTEMELPITGHRGFNLAEVTAGGVPLSEIRLQTMESRICPGLFLCGEICDVDGRIGGFNFQWAWASGYVAGRSA
jgi:predicted Rossmann fold flavoprotein